MRRIPMHMYDWVEKLDGFLTLNDRNILDHAGKVSHEMAIQHASEEYNKFHQQRLDENAISADEKDFENLAEQLNGVDKERKR